MLAIGTWILLCIAVVLLAVYLFVTTFARTRREGEPEVVKGHWLWGSSIEFNTHAVDFFHKATKSYGKVFTMRLINQYITIVNDPHSYEALHKERNFDFDPIQKQVNWNVFSFVLKEPRKMIKDTGKTVSGAKLGKSMMTFADKLDRSYSKVSEKHGVDAKWESDGLRAFASKTLFDALFNTIFGDSDAHFFNSQNTYKNFETFHKYFNYLWLGAPKKFFPDAMSALGDMIQQPSSDELLSRPDTSEYIRIAVNYMKDQGQSEADIIGHNLVFLHVNYNTFRLAFWVLNNILEDDKARAALVDEIEQAIAEKKKESNDGTVTFKTKDIEALPILDSICQESMRVSSGVFMIRYVQEDTQFTDSDGKMHLIRKGDRVAMYPPAIHKDPEIFENPEEFKYDRFVDQKFYKYGKLVKNPVIAFGSLCPGKRYAICQLKWYIMTVLMRFDMALEDGQHAQYDNNYHGHEILPPKSDINMRFREKETYPTMVFE